MPEGAQETRRPGDGPAASRKVEARAGLFTWQDAAAAVMLNSEFPLEMTKTFVPSHIPGIQGPSHLI